MVYVDELPAAGWGRWSGGGHLLASDLGELHAMARSLGIPPRGFQDKRFPHYDLPERLRRAAIAAGAVAIPFGTIPDEVLVRRREGGGYEPYGVRRARRGGA